MLASVKQMEINGKPAISVLYVIMYRGCMILQGLGIMNLTSKPSLATMQITEFSSFG